MNKSHFKKLRTASKKNRNKHAATPNLMHYREKILHQGSDYFKQLLYDINRAQYSIDFESYIFSKDSLAQKISDALIRASQRKVKVRVLIDGAGIPIWGNYLLRKMEKYNIETKIFHPFPWQVWHWSRSVVKLPLVIKWIYLLYKINSRNHRKTCVIDHYIAYVGSLNIDKCHLDEEQGGDHWHDTAVRISGVSMDHLTIAFNQAWTGRSLPERIQDSFRKVRENPMFRLNNNRHRRRILHKNLLKKIAQAKQRIWITNAYFVPDNVLLMRLREAAMRQVDVRILLPQKSDVFIMPWASVTFYHSLLKAGVRIFEYRRRILHSKTLIVDNWMLVGSSNLNHRSLLHDLEVDVNLITQQAKKALCQQFISDLDQANEVPASNWKSRPWYQRILGRIFLYLKYLI